MDKTIKIDGRNVIFRKTGGTAMRYKRQFGRELNADLATIYSVLPGVKATIETDKFAAMTMMLGVETEWMYDILFIMAQQADPSIMDEIEWLDSFDSFNVWTIFFELLPMLQAEQSVSPKNA